MLHEANMEVDECYTVTWRESKYTLLHVPRDHRLRRRTMKKVMRKLLEKYQILETEIFGFDSVSCNSRVKEAISSLEDHPGFQLMVEKVNKDPENLEWWMRCETENLNTNRKGLLWKHIESTDAGSMTRAQLVQRVRKWAPMVAECALLKETNVMLGESNQALIQHIHELEQTLRNERAFNDKTTMQLVAKIQDCGALERELMKCRPPV